MRHSFLGSPIAFHRVFVTLTGSVKAAVMLSQALYWSQRSEDGWFYKSCAEWEFETGLTRSEQETARRDLSTLDFFEEARRGMPATMHYRIDIERLEAAVITTPKPQFAEKPHTAKTRGLVGGKAAIKNAGKPQTTLLEEEITQENPSDTRAALFELAVDLPSDPFERWIVEQIRAVPAFEAVDLNPSEVSRLAVDLADLAPSEGTLAADFKNWINYEIGDTKNAAKTKQYKPIERIRRRLIANRGGRWAAEKSRNGTKPFDTMSFVRNLQGHSESTEDRALAILNGNGSFVR